MPLSPLSRVWVEDEIANLPNLFKKRKKEKKEVKDKIKVVNFVQFWPKHQKYFVLVLYQVQETPLKRTC